MNDQVQKGNSLIGVHVDQMRHVGRLTEHFTVTLDRFSVPLEPHIDHASVVIICSNLQWVCPVVDRSDRMLDHLQGWLEAASLEAEHGKLRVQGRHLLL